MRTIAKLKEIINSSNQLDSMIAHTILLNYEKGKSLKAKIISKMCNVSISTLTNFSKRLGYEGYSELYYRILVEKEFYKPVEENVNDGNMFHEKNVLISNLSTMISKSEKVFILKSEEVSNEFVSLFVHFLSRNKKVYYSNKRKIEKYYINEINNKSLFIIFATGLEINELWNNVDLYKEYKPKMFFITTNANKERIKKYNYSNTTIFIVEKEKKTNSVVRLMNRIAQINQLIIDITEEYQKNFYIL